MRVKSTTEGTALSKTDAKWTRKNNLFIISVLAEAQRAVSALTRLSGKADGGCGAGDGDWWKRGTRMINPTVWEKKIKTGVLPGLVMKIS